MMETKEDQDLELLFLDEPELECQSVAAHVCTHTARWSSMVDTPHLCSGGACSDPVCLWCDGRMRLHRADLEVGRLCRCLRSVAHWVVTPL